MSLSNRLNLTLAAALFCAVSAKAEPLTITGSVDYKYLISSMATSTTSSTLLKIAFENNTSGSNLSLCAGTLNDFAAGTCPMRISNSGGPGFRFLTLLDAAHLNGKYLYVVRSVGFIVSKFTLIIE